MKQQHPGVEKDRGVLRQDSATVSVGASSKETTSPNSKGYGLEQCQIRTCRELGRWSVVTTGHPNGDMGAWYCSDHAHTVPNWDDSPKVYSITVTGPYCGAA